MIRGKTEPIVMRIEDDPEEIAKANAQREQFRKNSDWLEAHIGEVYSKHRGKCICVAGQELFVADTGPEVVELARKAHPEDKGRLMRYIPLERLERIYAHCRSVENVR